MLTTKIDKVTVDICRQYTCRPALKGYYRNCESSCYFFLDYAKTHIGKHAHKEQDYLQLVHLTEFHAPPHTHGGYDGLMEHLPLP